MGGGIPVSYIPGSKMANILYPLNPYTSLYIKFDNGTVWDAKAWIWFEFGLDEYEGCLSKSWTFVIKRKYNREFYEI